MAALLNVEPTSRNRESDYFGTSNVFVRLLKRRPLLPGYMKQLQVA
jgi:hypothetical protein